MPKTKTKTETANIHAVVGSDEAEVKRVAAELAEKLAPQDAGDFGLEVIDGAADNADQAAARIQIGDRGAANVAVLRQYKTSLAEERELSGRRPKGALSGSTIRAGRIVGAARQRFRSRESRF